ncbi:MAG: anti-sigma factor family protein, partial [Planctomycetota bacterium]
MNCAECKEILVAYVEGLLEESQKQAVEEHLKDCSACQAETNELTQLHDRLVANGKVLAQGDLEDDVMNQIVRGQNVRLKAAGKAGAGLKLRRIIMKSPITKIAAAAVIIIAVLVGISQLIGPINVTTVTFADVVEPILNARTVIFDALIGDEESNPVIMHEIVAGSRIRRTISNLPNMTSIIDLESAKILALDTEAKTATYIDIKGQLQ